MNNFLLTSGSLKKKLTKALAGMQNHFATSHNMLRIEQSGHKNIAAAMRPVYIFCTRLYDTNYSQRGTSCSYIHYSPNILCPTYKTRRCMHEQTRNMQQTCTYVCVQMRARAHTHEHTHTCTQFGNLQLQRFVLLFIMLLRTYFNINFAEREILIFQW